MQLIIEILTAIGIRTVGLEAFLAFMTRLGGTAVFRNAFVRRKLIGWAGGILSLAEGVHWLEDVVKKWFSEVLGEKIDSLIKEDLLPAIGRGAAREFNKQMEERYGISCPIESFYSETLAEEFGQWIADVLNEKISERMGRDVQVVTTIFPPDQVPIEIDTFMTDEINLKLGLSLSGVFFNPNLISELETALREKVSEEITNKIEQIKGQAINDVLQNSSYDGDVQTLTVTALTKAFRDARNLLDIAGLFGKPLSMNAYYSGQKKKIHNKMRQRKWRETHREQRIWVPR